MDNVDKDLVSEDNLEAGAQPKKAQRLTKLPVILFTGIATVVLLIMFYGVSSSSENTKAAADAKAKEIALNHANVSQNQVSYINAHLDYDDGIQVYDVSLYVNDVEYSYEINAQNGNIVSYEMDSIYD